MDYDTAVAIFRVVLILFVLRQFWHSIFGGFFTCIVLVSPIWIYLALVAFNPPFELEMFRTVAAHTWDILFASPIHRVDVLVNLIINNPWYNQLDQLFKAT